METVAERDKQTPSTRALRGQEEISRLEVRSASLVASRVLFWKGKVLYIFGR